MENKRKRYWLLPTVLILFICEICTLPLVFYLTYAGNAKAPDHVLVYKNNKLTWSTNVDVRADGSAAFDVFSDKYQSVKSDNGDRVIAPGTGANTLIQLKNQSDESAVYIATLYMVNENDRVPLKAELDCSGKPTNKHALPEGVEAKVVCSYTGEVNAGEIADFNTDWKWDFYESDELDLRDTDLGNEAAWKKASEVTLGLYIVIKGDNGDPTVPESPQTGEKTPLIIFIGLIALTGGILLAAHINKRRRYDAY